MQPVAEHLLDECLKGWKGHGDIISKEDRWSNPPEASLSSFCSDSELSKSMAKLLPHTNKSAAQIWGACYNMLHTKHMAGKSESLTAYMWDHILVFAHRPTAGGVTTFTPFLMAENLGVSLDLQGPFGGFVKLY